MNAGPATCSSHGTYRNELIDSRHHQPPRSTHPDWTQQTLKASTDKKLSRPSVLARHFGDRARPKSDIREHLEPKRPWKKAELVCIVHDVHGTIARPQHERVVGSGAGVARVRVDGPRQVASTPTVRRVVSPMIDTRLEVLHDVVGHEHRNTALPAMLEGSLDRPSQIDLGDHVVDGIMHEHRVEAAPETHFSHISLEVVALRIQLPGDGQHLIR